MKKPNILAWFRNDLRLNDNPAFIDAANAGLVLPVYIFDTKNSNKFIMGAASKVWLHHSLQALNESLHNKLLIYLGDPLTILSKLIEEYKIDQVNWNRCYEKWQIDRDTYIKKTLLSTGIKINSFNGSLLWEPWEVLKADGTPYKVFTPYYYKGCLTRSEPRLPINTPDTFNILNTTNPTNISNLNLLPKIKWDRGVISHWQVGEKHAIQQLKGFVEDILPHYKDGRNFPAQDYISRLSPYLHFGEVSPNMAWYAVKSTNDSINADKFCSELVWREFSYNLLYHNPDLATKNLQKKFDHFPWVFNEQHLTAWQTGQTGIPIIDAGMRELWQTGFMHNRVRMLVASFLVKNLLIDWRIGERWFFDTLFDADLANNSASWQWVAGSGADAAPYFRIFNPILQGEKFDPQGIYIRKYVPELKSLDNKYIHSPAQAPESILKKANIILGHNYPLPIINLKQSRDIALKSYKALT